MIGVFDSGVGGLSVWREMAALMPEETIVYLADQAHVPYGPRELADVRDLTTACVGWLLDRGCDMIVIACNTASAAALSHVRALFPHIPFVGMEPAVKPAASHTHTGVIGVLATQATFHSQVFASVVMRFASNVTVIEQPCPGWVELVEGGAEGCQPLVDHYVLPLLDRGADRLVLGCTHFPFLAVAIQCAVDSWKAQHAAPYAIELVDPSQAVARQAVRVRDQNRDGSRNGAAPAASQHQFWTTGDAAAFSAVARRLLPDHQHFAAETAQTAPFPDVKTTYAATRR